MRLFYLSTKYGDQYFIHENGRIERCDGHCAPSDSWRLLGIETTSGKHEFIQFDKLREWLDANRAINAQGTLLFKNGNPRFTVRDLDHGTVRVWGNTKAHGIADLRPI